MDSAPDRVHPSSECLAHRLADPCLISPVNIQYFRCLGQNREGSGQYNENKKQNEFCRLHRSASEQYVYDPNFSRVKKEERKSERRTERNRWAAYSSEQHAFSQSQHKR
uniref:Uncharacterized protein n=1 Tax=Globodera rostochiensis TaxID=31243 RepID=A0A914HFT4_GLORO